MASLLAVDLGGTKSRVGLYDLDSGADSTIVQSVFANKNYSGIHEVITAFLEEFDVTPDYGCLAVAGVIDGDSAVMTNLPWQVNTQALQKRFSLRKVFLLNDLTALAASIPYLTPEETFEIKGGIRKEGETIAVIAPGTGLGQGYLVPNGEGYIIKGSEGGHSGFSPANEEQVKLLSWMMKSSESVSAEQVCAGPAITTLYHYFVQQNNIIPADWLPEKIRMADDITPVVVSAGTGENGCPVCRKVVETYLAILGRETANLALKLYSRGGVYIGGGVILHLFDKIPFTSFVDGFLHTDKMRQLMNTIPVFGIKKEDALLYGAYQHGMRQLQR